jgi:N-acetylglucosaminyl-diphospho-decaprenol L-rhamnosyltransferase
VKGTTVVLVHREQPGACVTTGHALEAQGARLLIVDNGSSEEARLHLKHHLPDAEFILLDGNHGFGPAANVGFRRWLEQGDGEWVGLGPHDFLPEPDCLPKLLDAVRDKPRAGLVSAEFGTAERPVVDPYFGGIQRPAQRGTGWEDAGHPHGTFMLARRQCLEEIGLFDERYFAYCEEADLGQRARDARWEVGIVWDAIVRNPNQASPMPLVEYLMLRNSLLLVRTHFGRYRTFIRICWALSTTMRQWLLKSQRTDWFAPRARLRGIADFLRGRFGPPPQTMWV